MCDCSKLGWVEGQAVIRDYDTRINPNLATIVINDTVLTSFAVLYDCPWLWVGDIIIEPNPVWLLLKHTSQGA